MKKHLFIIFLTAFFIRLINLNQSMWLDEATTAMVVKKLDYFSIINQFSPYDFHPPLYYLFIKFWTDIFGYSEISLRMPSIIFSLIAGYFVYQIGKFLIDQKRGLWAMLFFLFNPLIIYYSQEARMYMMATMFLTIALYYFLKLLNHRSKIFNRETKLLIFFGLFIVLAFLTFYGSIFLIAAFIFYFLYKKQYKNFFISLFVLFVFFILIISLLYQQLTNAKLSLNQVSHWSLVLGKANFKNLLLIPVKFFIGRIDFYPKSVYYLVALSWSIFVLTQILSFRSLGQKHRSKIKILFYLFLSPLLFGFLISFFTPLLQYFRFIYLIPILAVVLSFIDDFKRKILIGGFFIFSMAYLLIPLFHREDWRSLGKSLSNNTAVYMILPSSDPLYYYRPDLKINELREIDNQNNLPKKFYLIPYTAEIYGFSYEKNLVNKGYVLAKKQSFHRLSLEQWEKVR